MPGPERARREPLEGAARGMRLRLSLRGEFALALLPTATVLGVHGVLGVLGLVEALSRQRLLFASLARTRHA